MNKQTSRVKNNNVHEILSRKDLLYWELLSSNNKINLKKRQEVKVDRRKEKLIHEKMRKNPPSKWHGSISHYFCLTMRIFQQNKQKIIHHNLKLAGRPTVKWIKHLNLLI